MPSVEELRAAIVAVGEEIKSLKGAGTGKDKLQPHIDKLLGTFGNDSCSDVSAAGSRAYLTHART